MTDQELIQAHSVAYKALVVEDRYSVEGCRVMVETEGELISRGYVWDDESGWVRCSTSCAQL